MTSLTSSRAVSNPGRMRQNPYVQDQKNLPQNQLHRSKLRSMNTSKSHAGLEYLSRKMIVSDEASLEECTWIKLIQQHRPAHEFRDSREHRPGRCSDFMFAREFCVDRAFKDRLISSDSEPALRKEPYEHRIRQAAVDPAVRSPRFVPDGYVRTRNASGHRSAGLMRLASTCPPELSSNPAFP